MAGHAAFLDELRRAPRGPCSPRPARSGRPARVRRRRTRGAPRSTACSTCLDDLHDRLWAEAARGGAARAAGDGRVGQGRHHPACAHRPQPAGLLGRELQGARRRATCAHDYLWRIHEACPPRGILGVLNRSHYEDVVTARLIGVVDDEQVERRYRHIREFERMLTDEGTTVVKVFLHISKDEQRARLQARIDDPDEELEVQARRPRHPAPVGRLPAALRRGDHAPLHRLGAVVRRAGRPQVGARRRRGLAARRRVRPARPPNPRPGAGPRGPRRRVAARADSRLSSGPRSASHRAEWSTDGRRVA